MYWFDSKFITISLLTIEILVRKLRKKFFDILK